MPIENPNFAAADRDPKPVTVFVHIFHVEVWPEILAYLDRLTFPYQIVITSPHPRAAIQLPDNAVEIEVHQTANTGRDIGPFLTSLRGTSSHDRYLLKAAYQEIAAPA